MARADARREAVELLVDLTVYAPIGLLSLAREHLPELADTGRSKVGQRIALARMLGELVVRQGKRELRRRIDADSTAKRARTTSSSPPSAAPARGAATDADRADGGEPLAPQAAVPAATDLPIEGYESLAASQIVARLPSLDDAELTAVEAFERAHRDRRTIHGRIAQLRSER